MKTLSAAAQKAVDSPFVAPILFLDLEFSSPSNRTVRLCSRPFTTRNIFSRFQNFLKFTEVDPNSHLTVAENVITFADLVRNEDAWVYYDFGADYFDGDFEYQVEFNISAINSSASVAVWMLANLIDSPKDIEDASGDFFCVFLYRAGEGRRIYLRECDGGTAYSEIYSDFPLATDYYLTIKRDENIGTYGTIYCYIYSDADRTILVDTLSIALHTSKKDFRYLYGLNSNNWGTPYTISGTVSNLNIISHAPIYDPLIMNWGPIRCGVVDLKEYLVRGGDLTVDIDNSTPVGGKDRFSEVLKDYDWAFAVATVGLIFEGATSAGDEVEIFKGRIENPEKMNRERVSLRISDIAMSLKNNWAHTIVDAGTYAGADPNDIGKMLPQVWGSCKRVPFMAVDAGGITTLAADLTDVATTVQATDTTTFPSSGTIQIDSEQITYTGKTATSFTGCTRGANGTDAVEHNLGATIAEIQTDYFYIIGHAVKAIDAVYVDGVLQPASKYTAYTGQSGDEHAGYPGKACIKFTTLPLLIRQINVDVNDTIDVNDGIGVSQGSHSHAQSDVAVVWNFETATDDGGTPVYPERAADGDTSNFAEMSHLNDKIKVERAFYQEFQGTPSQYRLCGKAGELNGNLKFEFGIYTLFFNSSDDNEVKKTSWHSVSGSLTTWAGFNAATGKITSQGTNYKQICEVWVEIKYTPSTPASAATGVAKTGEATKTGTVNLTGNSVADTVIGARVSADLDGFQDDGDGLYTGTPNALIERYDHMSKHMIIDRLGQSAFEIHAASYNAAGSEYASNSFVLGVCLLEPPDPIVLFARMAFQSKSMQFWEAGKHHLKFFSSSPSSDKEISGHRIDLGVLTLDFTLRAEIKNKLSAAYDKHWSGRDTKEMEDLKGLVTASDATSQSKYGVLEGKILIFNFITTEAHAQAVLNWRKDELANPRLMLNFIGDISLVDLERGDVINFDLEDENKLKKAMLGLVTHLEGDL